MNLSKLLSLVIIITIHSTSFSQNIVGLPENASNHIKEWAPIFDFDNDCCYPSPAISESGTKNKGLKTSGHQTGDCRYSNQLNNANTYVRSQTVKENGNTYEFILYALYFEKDQVLYWSLNEKLDPGHKHDWEWAAVWLKNGKAEYASFSAHGKNGDTRLFKNQSKNDSKNVKLVYSKDKETTRIMRFAKNAEKAENELGRFYTPKIVQWDRLSGQQREALASDWGSANCPLSNKNFFKQLYNYLPQNKGNKESGFPDIEKWLKSNNSLLSGETLFASKTQNKTLSISGQDDCILSRIYSQNKKFYMTLKADGNMCIYESSNNKFVWCSMAHDFKEATLRMELDGNLVVYDKDGNPKWSSKTQQVNSSESKDSSKKPVKLVLENDGKLKLYNALGNSVWINN